MKKIIDNIKDYIEFYNNELGIDGIYINKPISANNQIHANQTKETNSLEDIKLNIGDCKRCKLHLQRKNIVFGTGNEKAELMFIGEGPGEDEDIQGKPFVGKAGQLLTKIIESMGITREDVYIANIVKCRPPNNRVPESDEITTCIPFLIDQIGVIKPKIICALGAIASQTLLNTKQPISKIRGKFYDYKGIKLIPTFHPSYLLRNPSEKKVVWEDIKKIMKEMNLPERQKE